MTQFSANLGFLFTDMALTDATVEAARAGFAAVECHWPYETATEEMRRALAEANLQMLGLNTRRGDIDAGENGLAAVPDREADAKAVIDEAIDYAASISCANVHVMAGKTDRSESAELTFQRNLAYACDKAAKANITILIEPLNHFDAPGYHLYTLDQALQTQAATAKNNLKIMFDCYHMQIMHGDLSRRLSQNLDRIGHIQFAAVPDRGEPDEGEVHYPHLMSLLDQLGWQQAIGAEYKPRINTADGLGWMNAYKDKP
ncbi:MAG: TIM barrel protein [Granulosicoccus sp.]|nr:TIM barrel protein [Granulosicoccus sp.]